MFKRRNVYAALGVVGALALLLTGLAGISAVSAEDETPDDEIAHCGVFGRMGGLFGFGGGDQWTMFDTVAQELELTPEDLFAEMRAGNTLEEVAEERGVDVEVLQEALSSARDEAMGEAIEQAVEDGEMSEDQGDWLLEGLEKGYMPGRGFSPSFRHGGHGMRGSFFSSESES